MSHSRQTLPRSVLRRPGAGLMVHGAEIEIAGPDGGRRVPLAEFYNEDGADWLRLERHELITAIHVPSAEPASRTASAYTKVRIRGAVDFPLARVAVACRRAGNSTVHVTAAVTGTNSRPFLIEGIEPAEPDQDRDTQLAKLEKLVQKQVSPQRTTTTASHYRRLAVSALARRLATQLASDLD